MTNFLLSGFVTLDLKPIVRLTILDKHDHEHEQDVIVDTGFNGSLLLPQAVIAQLELESHQQSLAQLADGREIALDAYRLTMLSNGRRKTVVALASDGEPLLGMRLILDHAVFIEVKSGGAVSIEPRN